MEIIILQLDTNDESFENDFAKYKTDFLKILSSSFPNYYGDVYQLKRITDGKAILFLAIVDGLLVGVSYIKNNFRRGGTAVYPEKFRGLGIAEELVKASLKPYPHQYTILRADNIKMVSLMERLGFKRAKTIDEIKNIVQNEFSQLSEFELINDYVVFSRQSLKRGKVRERLILLHTF